MMSFGMVNICGSLCMDVFTVLRPRICKRASFLASHFHMSASSFNTIFGLSSGAGKAGVAVIRVSGPQSVQVISKMTNIKQVPPLKVTKFKDSTTGEFLDRGILLYFKAPKSFTGEDVCELHVHGGVAVIAAMLNSLSKISQFRQALPGEFTRRAFINGKLDLTAVEGLADLIAAETEAQRKQAVRQMDGELQRLYSGWRNQIIKIAAYVEAFIDFSEDENIDVGLMNTVESEAKKLLSEIETHVADNRRGERLRNGVHVVIIGQPNVGKSSLLNIISQRPAAIVSPIAGTTRDVVECHVNIGGYPVLVSDTAGLRHSQDDIEKEGIKRALDRARLADLLVLMLEPDDLTEVLGKNGCLDDAVKSLVYSLGLNDAFNSPKAKKMIVVNKIDKSSGVEMDLTDLLKISCTTRQGIDNLIDKLKATVKELCDGSSGSEIPALTQQRHRIHLNSCVERLKTFFENKDTDMAIAAYHLRKAGGELGKISGEFTTEDLLDVIFKDFCIGK
ncbi:tRNA modification GTPase gtpbp3, mitochondrial [Chamberlinius hualienensis]